MAPAVARRRRALMPAATRAFARLGLGDGHTPRPGGLCRGVLRVAGPRADPPCGRCFRRNRRRQAAAQHRCLRSARDDPRAGACLDRARGRRVDSIVWLIARVDLPGSGPLMVAVTVPFVLPTVVVGIVFRAVLGGPLAGLGIESGFWAVPARARLSPTWRCSCGSSGPRCALTGHRAAKRPAASAPAPCGRSSRCCCRRCCLRSGPAASPGVPVLLHQFRRDHHPRRRPVADTGDRDLPAGDRLLPDSGGGGAVAAADRRRDRCAAADQDLRRPVRVGLGP